MRVGHVFVWIVFASSLGACHNDALSPRSDQGDGTATLSWQPPTKNENGEPLTDLVSYHILYGRSADDLRYSIRIADPKQTSTVINGLGRGKWFFAIIAVNAAGQSSKPSNIETKEFQ